MLNDRRNFIIGTGMAAGCAMVGRLVADQKFTEGESAEADVKVLISRYGRVAKMTKDASGIYQVKVKIRNHGPMAKFYSNQHHLPFSKIRSTAQNTLEFKHRGERFSLTHHV